MYYLRTRPKADAIKFTVDVEKLAEETKNAKLSENVNKENATASAPSPGKTFKGLSTVDDDEGCLNWYVALW